MVTVDTSVIDADYRGIIQVLLINHHLEKTFTFCTGDRIAQVVFMETFTTNFQKVTDKHFLGKTKRENDGFGLSGVSVIKKKKSL